MKEVLWTDGHYDNDQIHDLFTCG